MMEAVQELGLIGKFAASIGASDTALRLLISLLAGYPLGFIHRFFLYAKSPWKQHLYFIAVGLSLCYFNFGWTVIHSIVNILLVYAVLLICPGTALSVILSFIINVTYLVVGYYSQMTPNYVVSWTTPHCVLALRLIGLVFDIYDGQRDREKLSAEEKETAISGTPSLLAIAGHVYFFGGFLVGPQFPMKRYSDFVEGKFSDQVTGGLPRSYVRPAILRLVGGLLYTVLFQIGYSYFPDEYLYSEEFSELSFFYRCMFVTVWGKITLYKYLAAWLITEGICTLAGLTYNGKDENGNDLWDACANIKIRKFERANTLTKCIDSFNINTNKWMFKYVFKRLKFLNNKRISHFSTLFFLALWHGLYSGYFMCFFLEFIMISFEKELSPVIEKQPLVVALYGQRALHPFLWIITKLYSTASLSYALVSFCLFTYNRWGSVYAQVYFIGHIFFISLLFLSPMLKPSRHSRTSKTNGTSETSKKTE